jgi:YVTN family beta-propeller protein
MRSWPRTVALAATLVLSFAAVAYGSSWTALVSQEGHLVTSPPSGASVSTIDLGANPPVGSSPVTAPNPFEVAISPDASTAYVANVEGCSSSSANQVLPIDLTGTPAAALPPIALGSVGAFGLVTSPDGKTVYASGCGKVLPIDVTATPALVGAPIAVGADPFALVVSRDGRTLWAADHTGGTVAVVDLSLATPATVKTITVGRQPLGMALTPDGATLYVANGKDCTISVIETATETAAATPITLPPAACSGTPQGFFGDPGRLAMSPDGTTLYAASLDAQVVTPIDTATGTPQTPISFTGVITPTGLPFKPGGLAFAPDGKRLLVADAGGNPGGQFGNTVQVVSTPANVLSGTPIALNSPLGTGNDVAVTPDQAPVADFTVASAPPGSATSFDASASTVRFGAIASYAWDFGDGTTTTTSTPTVTHVYAAAGTYAAGVTETDGAGTSLAATTLMTGRTLVRRGSDSAGTTRSVVIATGPQPAVSLSSAALDFGAAPVGTASRAQTVRITNSGAASLTITTSTLGGATAGDFALSADGCTGKTVVASATCTVDVTFTPAAGGSRSARLAFADDASGSPHTVALSGVGTTTGTITGTVQDTTHSALPGAAITRCTPTFTVCTGALADAQGHFRFASVEAGKYLLTIQPPAGSTLSTGSRLATVAAGQTDDAVTVLGHDAPLSKSITITSPMGSQAGGHPTLYWDDPFTIELPKLKALGNGTPGTAVETTIFVSFSTAGTGQTVLGSALHYLVRYGPGGKPADAIVLDDPLPGVIDAGFDFTIGGVAAPAGQPVRIDPDQLAAATDVTAATTGLRRAAHGNLTLSILPLRITVAATGSGRSSMARAADACDTFHQLVADRQAALEVQIERLADAERTGDYDAIDGIQRDIYKARETLLDAKIDEAHACLPPSDPSAGCDNIFAFDDDGTDCPPDADVPIDPSGFVRTQGGVPLEHAKVVLERADTAAGRFTAPPKGDAVMSADNRRNPDHSDINGHFGWDVFPGYYRVRATRPGCHGTAVTKARPVPPPVTDLLLKLRCPGLKRSATSTRVVATHRRGPSTVVTLRTRAGHRRVTGLVRLTIAGKTRGFGFLDAHGQAKVTVAGHPHGRIAARYAGNARFAPSAGHLSP